VQFIDAVVAVVFFLPLTAFALLGMLVLLRVPLQEAAIARLTGAAMGTSLLATMITLAAMAIGGRGRIVVDLGEWFAVTGYDFEFVLLVDELSLPFMLLTTALVGLIGKFSRSYMHRDAGYNRFFVLLLLFTTGMLLIVMAGSIDLMFAGWEIVGLTSALLIGFFHNRQEPVLNGLRTFAVYRVCDIGLLVGAVLIHHWSHTAEFDDGFSHGHPHLQGAAPTIVGLLMVFAAMGKSAQVPFSGWLPRAMEGPTPSSAIFYGALSIHAGSYLLLRMGPILDRAPLACAALVLIGVASAVHGTLVGRVQSDAKNSLAYASMVQVGLILVEIGLGWRLLALVHIVGHASVRTLQFLRAPSMLHDFHLVESASGGELGATGTQYGYLLPARVRSWLYRLALERGYHDEILMRFVVSPVLRLAGLLDLFEQRLVEALGGSSRPPSGSTERVVEAPRSVDHSRVVVQGSKPT
jgi:NAD(P)H-quinone oxidoreductase subunit 5